MFFLHVCISEFEAQIRDLQHKRSKLAPDPNEPVKPTGEIRVGLGQEGHFDTDIYDKNRSRFDEYVTSIATTDDQDVSVCKFSLWLIH